jgi:hypothetical protein
MEPTPIPDEYCDQAGINFNPFGATLNFFLTNPVPSMPGMATQPSRVATIRMSMEHLKMMTFVIRRQIQQYERDNGVSIQIPQSTLTNSQISREDWEAVWK